MNTTEITQEQQEQPLQPLTIGKHTSRYPIIQGGMGVRVSTPGMASEVILSGGIGTLSSVGLPLSPEYKDYFHEMMNRAPQGELEDIQRNLIELKELLETNKRSNIPATQQQNLITAIRELEFEVSKYELRELKEKLKNLIQLRKETQVPNIPLKENKYTPDIEQTQKDIQAKGGQMFLQINAFCLKKDIEKTRELAGGKGPLFVNIMSAASGYNEMVQAACEAGIDGIVSGAGLPMSLPELTKEYPSVALIPIVSNVRTLGLIYKKWEKLGRLPDAVVFEEPKTAGGHLGANGGKIANINDPDTTLEIAIPAAVDFFKEKGVNIPIIGAGGIASAKDVRRVLALGASGVQPGILFASSQESGFKQEVINAIIAAKEGDIMTYISSAGLPARALRNSPIFKKIQKYEARIIALIEEEKDTDKKEALKKGRPCNKLCLKSCKKCDGIKKEEGKAEDLRANMCILEALVAALKGSKDPDWLCFVGTSAVKIKVSKKVKEIMDDLTQEPKAA